jgi:hypothetical protein
LIGPAFIVGCSELGLLPWDHWVPAASPSTSFWPNATAVSFSIHYDGGHNVNFTWSGGLGSSGSGSVVYNDEYLFAYDRLVTGPILTIWCISWSDVAVSLTNVKLNGALITQDFVLPYNYAQIPFTFPPLPAQPPEYVTLSNDQLTSSSGFLITADATISWDGALQTDDLARCQFNFQSADY